MNKIKTSTIETWINIAAIASITFVTFGYVFYRQLFAEQHFVFEPMQLPVFVGEQLFGFCMVLCMVKWALVLKWNFGSKEKVAVLFFAIVLLKAVTGYLEYGALALRHAAMYNYMLFIYFGLFFFELKDYRKISISIFILFLVMYTMYRGYYYRDWFMGLFVLGFIALAQIRNIRLKWILTVFYLILIPWKHMFVGSRMLMIGNCLSVIYLIFILSLAYAKKIRPVYIIIFIFILGAGYYKYSDKTELESIFRFDLLIEKYQIFNQRIKEREHSYVMKEIDVRLYNPSNIPQELQKGEIGVNLSKENNNIEKEKIIDDKEGGQLGVEYENSNRHRLSNVIVTQVDNEQIENNKKDGTGNDNEDVIGNIPNEEGRLSVTLNNFLFRVFIWRDMIRDLCQEKPLFGFDFGKPLRVKSLEVSNWGGGEWGRDGWVAAHNSFLHIIYRTGVLGVFLIFALFYQLFKFVTVFVRQKSIYGMLLSTVIVGWFIKANFLLGLEFPYSAIPLWTIFGITWKYYEYLENQKDAEKGKSYELEK